MFRVRAISKGLCAVLVPALVCMSCGSDKDASGAPAPSGGSVAASAAPAVDEMPNACPVEGCKITIAGAELKDGEIALTLEANYQPDFERNHMHFFWDSQEPGAVSSDYAEKGFAVQGKWHPTDVFPNYSTQADASVDSEFRGDSTTICVTAANTDHAVLDASIVDCRDVSDLLK